MTFGQQLIRMIVILALAGVAMAARGSEPGIVAVA